MSKTFIVLVLLALAGCATPPPSQVIPASPCLASEASYACQIERYQNVNV